MASVENSHGNHGRSPDENPGVAVVMVPFPAHGHLNQLLQLSCLVSSYGLPVFYAASEIHNRQAKVRVNGIDSQQVAGIRFHDMPISPFESPLPDPDSKYKLSQLVPSWYATLSMRRPFGEFLSDLSKRFSRVVVVHDLLMCAVVQDVASVENAESYLFNCLPVFFKVPLALAVLGDPIPEAYSKLPSFAECFPEEVLEFIAVQREHTGIRAGDLFNTCRLIEGAYLEIVEREEIYQSRKCWAIGPLVSMMTSSPSSETRHECLRWLDRQEPKSVIYVSFGTTTSLSNEQMKELAFGLEESRVKFIWVVRDADKGDIFDGKVRRAELPEGFEDRVAEAGLLVRDWAPQPEILGHPSTGGFMSHCGWNSCLESITMGVPIAAWPVHTDQPANTMLLTEVLKMGLVVRDWSRREEIVKAPAIKDAVVSLMATEEGIKLRKNAEELAATVQQATQPGGATRLEFEAFIAHITR